MKFTDKLWKNIAPIYDAIINHPFNKELAAGTLSAERFTFYIQQDTLYLAEYGRALSLLASRSPAAEYMRDFIRFAGNIFNVERDMHGDFFKTFHITSPAKKQAPVCFAYTNYLIATAAHRSYEEGVAAVLPCFWIYREAGNHIYRSAAPDNPYQNWIDTYAGEEFSASVDRAIAITDAAAASAPDTVRALMEQAFENASRLEWMFWDSAWRTETWPPAL